MNIPRGFLTSGIPCGLKKKGKDVGLIWCERGAVAAGVFTSNVNNSYSVDVCRKNIGNKINALIVNSGNANCFTHKNGLKDTLGLCASCASALKIRKERLLLASTGIIGRKLPFTKIRQAVPHLVRNLKGTIDDFAESIMTTDTCRKIVSRTVSLGKEKVTITACAKGAGMINPQMATMLAFVLTDAALSRARLRKSLAAAVEKSFNSISVDGCMSTNDSVFLLSSGLGAQIRDGKPLALFEAALTEVCIDLAKMLVKDGEGATKFIQIDIRGARTEREARTAFQYIAGSALFRTAMYGENPNWGRIVASLGHAGIKVREGAFKVTAGSLRKKDITLVVSLGRGTASARGWCCDCSPEYIKINAGYS